MTPTMTRAFSTACPMSSPEGPAPAVPPPAGERGGGQRVGRGRHRSSEAVLTAALSTAVTVVVVHEVHREAFSQGFFLCTFADVGHHPPVRGSRREHSVQEKLVTRPRSHVRSNGHGQRHGLDHRCKVICVVN